LDNWLYLPLKVIKGIGDNIVSEILKEREERGIFRNFDDFIERCHPSKSTLEGLVYSGALDVLGKSKLSMLESQNKQQQIFNKYIKGKIDTDTEYDFEVLKEKEKEYIGINLQYNLFINIDELYVKYKSIPLAKLKEKVYSNTIAAFSDLKEIKTKKGELMLLGSLEDDKSTIRFTIFPKVYGQIPYGTIVKNKLFVMRGTLEYDNKKELTFTITNIAPIK
jgi:DNA polymerase-3 subunit alpha